MYDRLGTNFCVELIFHAAFKHYEWKSFTKNSNINMKNKNKSVGSVKHEWNDIGLDIGSCPYGERHVRDLGYWSCRHHHPHHQSNPHYPHFDMNISIQMVGPVRDLIIYWSIVKHCVWADLMAMIILHGVVWPGLVRGSHRLVHINYAFDIDVYKWHEQGTHIL